MNLVGLVVGIVEDHESVYSLRLESLGRVECAVTEEAGEPTIGLLQLAQFDRCSGFPVPTGSVDDHRGDLVLKVAPLVQVRQYA